MDAAIAAAVNFTKSTADALFQAREWQRAQEYYSSLLKQKLQADIHVHALIHYARCLYKLSASRSVLSDALALLQKSMFIALQHDSLYWQLLNASIHGVFFFCVSFIFSFLLFSSAFFFVFLFFFSMPFLSHYPTTHFHTNMMQNNILY
jgi:hypothetical protein